jgi:hypothetical protein
MRFLIPLALVLGFFSRTLAQFPKSPDTAAAAKSPDTSMTSSSGTSGTFSGIPGAEDFLPVNKRALGSLSALKTITIELEKASPSGLATLFHHFEVIDERPDTARIGVRADRGLRLVGARNKQLVFNKPVAGEIESFLNTRFTRPGAPWAALVVIRTLWLSDANNIREDIVKDPEKNEEKTKIRLKAEIYAEKDGWYTPLYRFDSLQISLRKGLNLGTNFGSDLSDMLEEMADSATLLLGEKGKEGRKISRADILQFNQSRFDSPICKDGPFVKGAYMTFQEFRDNAPSISDCEIKKDKEELILYVKESGDKSYYSHTAWGYCDGKTVYVMKDGILVPAWKEGKAWYLFSRVQNYDPSKHHDEGLALGSYPASMPSSSIVAPVTGDVMHGTGGLVATGLIGPRRPGTQLHIFTVDMDTGQLY